MALSLIAFFSEGGQKISAHGIYILGFTIFFNECVGIFTVNAYFVHEFVKNWLEANCLVELVPGKGSGEEDEGS